MLKLLIINDIWYINDNDKLEPISKHRTECILPGIDTYSND